MPEQTEPTYKAQSNLQPFVMAEPQARIAALESENAEARNLVREFLTWKMEHDLLSTDAETSQAVWEVCRNERSAAEQALREWHAKGRPNQFPDAGKMVD